MKKGFLVRVKRLIRQADVILEVLDARFPQATRNPDLEQLISSQNKQLLLVLNKSDLVKPKKVKNWEKKLKAVAISSKKRKGLNKLRQRLALALKGKPGVVSVIGYPNTGKSSLINALKGRKVAPVSLTAGFTRGEKLIRISRQLMLIDSPGIIPFREKDEFRLVLTASKTPNQIKEAELVALKLIELFLKENPSALHQAYQAEATEPEEILRQIALKKGRLLKGGLPDTETAARQFLWDYQKGKVRLE